MEPLVLKKRIIVAVIGRLINEVRRKSCFETVKNLRDSDHFRKGLLASSL
jgi:hypothetical protein